MYNRYEFKSNLEKLSDRDVLIEKYSGSFSINDVFIAKVRIELMDIINSLDDMDGELMKNLVLSKLNQYAKSNFEAATKPMGEGTFDTLQSNELLRQILNDNAAYWGLYSSVAIVNDDQYKNMTAREETSFGNIFITRKNESGNYELEKVKSNIVSGIVYSK